jgi:hypothetical protein
MLGSLPYVETGNLRRLTTSIGSGKMRLQWLRAETNSHSLAQY